jgi:hypothetical protein
MNLDGVRSALRREPFHPFALRLADGRSVPVRHSEFVAIGARLIGVFGEGDEWSVIEPLMIVSLDSLPATNGGGNGRRRRRPPRE